MNNPNAIMRAPLTVEEHLSSRCVVMPLHLFDLCLVNDGAVCLIVRRADRSRGLQHAPVQVGGWGRACVMHDKMHTLERAACEVAAVAAIRAALIGNVFHAAYRISVLRRTNLYCADYFKGMAPRDIMHVSTHRLRRA
jgi:acetyl-CoA acetyltransferase